MIERQVLKYLYDNYPYAIFMTLLLGALLCRVVVHEDNSQRILFWYIALVIVQGIRLADYLYYLAKHNAEIYSIYAMFRNFRGGIGLTGLLMGLFPILLLDTLTLTELSFVAFVFAGINAAATSSLGVDRPSLLLYLSLSLLPLALSFFSLGGEMTTVMGIMILLFVVYLFFSAGRYRKRLEENVFLREEAVEREKALKKRQRLSELIVQIQEAYLENQLDEALFEKIMEETIALSGCQYGFICQTTLKSKNVLSSKVIVNAGDLYLTKLTGDELKIDELNLRPLSLEAYFSQAVVSGEDIEVDHIEIRLGQPPELLIGHFYGYPFLVGGKVIGVLGLIYAYESMPEGTVDFLNPLFHTLERLFLDYKWQI